MLEIHWRWRRVTRTPCFGFPGISSDTPKSSPAGLRRSRTKTGPGRRRTLWRRRLGPGRWRHTQRGPRMACRRRRGHIRRPLFPPRRSGRRRLSSWRWITPRRPGPLVWIASPPPPCSRGFCPGAIWAPVCGTPSWWLLTRPGGARPAPRSSLPSWKVGNGPAGQGQVLAGSPRGAGPSAHQARLPGVGAPCDDAASHWASPECIAHTVLCDRFHAAAEDPPTPLLRPPDLRRAVLAKRGDVALTALAGSSHRHLPDGPVVMTTGSTGSISGQEIKVLH